MVLVDTSVWVQTFRRRKPFDLEGVVSFEEIVTCLPVIQEVLQGFSDEHTFRTAREAMYSLPVVEVPLAGTVFDQAVALYRGARRQGLTVRSSVDCLIAACAIRNDLTVLHVDRDYTALAKVSELKQKAVPKI